MTEQEAKIKYLELRVKKLEDTVFKTWLDQYDNINIEDFPPFPSTQACSLEDQMEQTRKWSEFIAKHPEYR